MAYYAWSDIRGGTADEPVNVARGAEVTQSKLGVGDAEWEELKASGAVRDKKFPAPDDFEGSAVDYLRQQLQEATSMSGVAEEEAIAELAHIEEPRVMHPEEARGEESKPEAKGTGKK
jgi:hypothetical protein